MAIGDLAGALLLTLWLGAFIEVNLISNIRKYKWFPIFDLTCLILAISILNNVIRGL